MTPLAIRRRRVFASAHLLMAIICLTLPGCERSSSPKTESSVQSAAVDLVRNPDLAPGERDIPCPRILSAAPNVTEICCALGLRDCLIGRTRYCTWPPDITFVPSIGALNDLNTEVLLSLEPELIIVSGTSRQTSDRLGRLTLPYISIPDTTLDDLFAAIYQIGEHVNRPQTATRLSASIRSRLARVVRNHAGLPSRSVLILTAPLTTPPGPVSAAGPASFYDDLLHLIHQQNAAAPAGAAFAPLSIEFILAADPDVIIELCPDRRARPQADADARRAWAPLADLRAVQAERIHTLIGEQYFILGPRIAQTLAELSAIIARES